MKAKLLYVVAGSAFMALSASAAHALVVTQTTNGSDLAAALGGAGLTINTVTTPNGAASQFGTYTGFSSPPVTIGNGVVLSSGNAVDTVGPASSSDIPSTNTGAGGTTEFNAYGPGHITNFSSSNDVAKLDVNFTLAAPGKVKFDFVFGSIEFPNWVSNFTDAFLVFLDGNQITFDGAGNPVQVGASFASLLTTADTNTAFADPHGLISNLTTVSPLLAAGTYDILFEVGDVNDHILDSAAFIANFSLCDPAQESCKSGTTPPGTAPEPASLALLGLAVAGFAAIRRRKMI